MAVALEAENDVTPAQREAVRGHLEKLSRYVDDPIEVHATVRRAHSGRGARPYIVDAQLDYNGRRFAAHASGPSPRQAAEEAARQLRRRLRGSVGAEVALRNDPRALRRALADLPVAAPAAVPYKAAPERRIVRRVTDTTDPLSTDEAISVLIREDRFFQLFVHVRTGEDVVVHRIDDEDLLIGLLHPQGSALADEGDAVVVPQPSRYDRPLTVEEAGAELETLGDRFVYFTDAADRRGKVLYPRRDGDYGLVEPA
jgi:ribosome-associated translation inhibitor RaiA